MRPFSPLSSAGEYSPLMSAALEPVAPPVKTAEALELKSAMEAASAATTAPRANEVRCCARVRQKLLRCFERAAAAWGTHRL